MKDPRYIVVEGPIGVGKTSLARRLADDFEADLILETSDDNPFLSRFYRGELNMALPTQLHFMLERVEQLRPLQEGELKSHRVVSDYMLDKEMLFATMNLHEDEMTLYRRIMEQMQLDAPVPDLVIYLQAPVQVLINRIGRRAISHEQSMSPSYLEKLNEAYANYFHHYNASPLLIINATEIDFVNQDEDYKLLLDHIRRIDKGRHFFSPTMS